VGIELILAHLFPIPCSGRKGICGGTWSKDVYDGAVGVENGRRMGHVT